MASPLEGKSTAAVLAIALVIIIVGAALGALIATWAGLNLIWPPIVGAVIALGAAYWYVKKQMAN